MLAASLPRAETMTRPEPATRDDAIRSIPWRQIAAAAPPRCATSSSKTQAFTAGCRHASSIATPSMFTFLLQHPEVVIDVWRVMGISQVTLDKLPDGAYRGTDGAGTTGTVRFLHTDWGHERP